MAARQEHTSGTYFFAGGGTAGHVNPALAVAGALRELDPQAQIKFLVTAEGLEKDLVCEAGYESLEIKAAPLSKKPKDWPTFINRNWHGFRKAKQALAEANAKVALGTGGFVSVPLIVAASRSGVPSILHEQNALPGKSNRFLARYSDEVALSFPGTEKYFKARPGLEFSFTGNPVKPAFYNNDRATARTQLGIDQDQLLIVGVGGSLGAKSLNEAVQGLASCPQWSRFLAEHPNVKIVLSAGKVNKRFIQAELSCPQIEIYDYLDTGLWLPAADLLVGRASGGFLAEAAVVGRPSILVPFPQAANDHQSYNAKVFVEQGASILLTDRELNSDLLLGTLSELLSDPERLEKMGQEAASLGRKDAAMAIAKLILKLADKKRG
ncbi:MAG: UDP-N-acetylglucosamine--N-acetylmuramyl-(pentapeptide) pyrophosphoryl-undecaprenol N-acetylglucosamine transferase [Eubacteriales bacterium]|nr:UDP-N-acetylglucosamine--N-acetylmuramyl-(pentapeptide) pyrophosphoryl-undecaprenol N-acetylglucosamine transferase [Eubacteriales bacterium]